MTVIASILKTIISVLLAISNIVLPSVFGTSNAANAPLDAKNCLLNFAAISDTHIHEDGDGGYNDMIFSLVMPDMEKAESKLDALVVAGDVTDHGEEAQWQYLQNLISQYDPAEKILLAVGNHDTWTDEGKKSAKQLFVEYSKKITGTKVSNVYYSTTVNGYYFIFLGSEKDNTDAYFSQKQLNWLDGEMKKAAKTKKPIFVVSHWPLNETHGLPETWGDDEYTKMTGGMGEQSAKVKNILNKYKNVFLISGHIHSGLSNTAMAERNGYQSIEKYGNIVSVNLPTINAVSSRGHFMLGTGYNVEVYKDKVVFRARNYAAECWLPGYDYTVKLK